MFIITIFVFAISIIYFLNKYFFNYWTRRGFPQLQPKFLIGNIGDLLRSNVTMAEFFEKIYRETKKSSVAVGMYNFYKPTLVVNDPELIQNILIRDFNYFHDRGMAVDEKNDPLAGHLFSLAGQKWRDLRVKLSPTFTTNKLKVMFPIIQECGETLSEYIEKSIASGHNDIDIKDLFSRYNTNIISSVAFGIENDCINNPNHIFHKTGLRFFETTVRNTIRNLAFMLAPSLAKILHVKFVDDDIEKFFIGVVRETVEYREKNNLKRNDFMNLLIELKNQGYVSADKDKDENYLRDKRQMKLNLNEISAQAFVFFLASFETSSSTMSFCLFEIAKNQQIQQRVQNEIDQLLRRDEGINYDSIANMRYLDACIDETLRKYVPVPTLIRECTNDYRIPQSNLSIPRGTLIQIPVYGMHRDAEIFDHPLEFRPERFIDSPVGGGSCSKGLFYLPFGNGPRNCIGIRMGKIMVKLGLFKLLSKYSFEVADRKYLSEEIKFHKQQVGLMPEGQLRLRAKSRAN